VGVDRPPSSTLGRCPYEGESQGLGKVVICLEWPNVSVPGIWLPAWTDAAKLPRLGRVGYRMSRTNRHFAGALPPPDAHHPLHHAVYLLLWVERSVENTQASVLSARTATALDHCRARR
jgi:hypothetical protein